MVVHGQCDQGGERHDAKATHLHGEDEHALAEGGPMRGGVDDGDSACGNGGYCGEERGVNVVVSSFGVAMGVISNVVDNAASVRK